MHPILPGEQDGYTEAYKSMQELMLPLNTRFTGEDHAEDTSWPKIRHALRRVSLLPSFEHPFDKVYKKQKSELFNELPEDVKSFIEACPDCQGIEDVRDRFTRGVVFWNQYFKDRVKRASRPEDFEGTWWSEANLVDKWVEQHKPNVILHFSRLRREPSSSSVIEILVEPLRVASHDVEAGDMAKKKPRRSVDMDEEDSTARLSSMSIEPQIDARQHHSQPKPEFRGF